MNTHVFAERIRAAPLVRRTGRVRKILPSYVEADGPAAPLGALCVLEARRADGARCDDGILAEVVRIDREAVILAPFDSGSLTFSGARVVARDEADTAPVGDGFMGRAVDALGRPMDKGPPVRAAAHAGLRGGATQPLDRTTPKRPLQTGVRAIDGLLTLGEGQRVGVFAPAGVGKTSLMAQLARQVGADRCVICLIGERGREVEALWRKGLPEEVKARTALVAATSDQTAAMRVRASAFALALAEHWRAEGLHVLLLVDSVTRLAMAMREIGLAAGEPPTVRAYTPSVFAAMPRLVERCGALASGGSITAVMTVLAESTEVDDPISEMMKSILDGHLLLSRDLAEQGHFPAIDVPRSVSRLASHLADDGHLAAARQASALLSTYESSRTLIEAGVYVRGSNPEIDQALEQRPGLLGFLRQGGEESVGFEDTVRRLRDLVGRRVAA